MRFDHARRIRRLFRDEHGYAKNRAEERIVRAVGSSAMYGELLPTATEQLLHYLDLSRRDAFYDLGSGIGKVALQAAITVPIRRVVGIEMMASRFDIACRVLDRIEDEAWLRAETCELWCADFMTARLTDATVIYTCSTAFPPALMNRLADRIARLDPKTRFVTLQSLDDDDTRFSLVDVLRLDTSWKRRTPVHVYRRAASVRPRRLRSR